MRPVHPADSLRVPLHERLTFSPGRLLRASGLAMLLVLVMLSGCLTPEAPPEGPDDAAPEEAPAPLGVREAAGMSGEFVFELEGNISTSFNRCQAGHDEVAVPPGYDTVVAVLRWEPASSSLRLALDADGARDPQPEEATGEGTLRATWDDLPPGTFTLRVEPAADLTVATQYHAHAVVVPAGVDPASVDPVAMAAVPGGC